MHNGTKRVFSSFYKVHFEKVRNSPLTHLEYDDEHVELLAPRGSAGGHVEGDVLEGARLRVEGRVQVEGHPVGDRHQEGERPDKWRQFKMLW